MDGVPLPLSMRATTLWVVPMRAVTSPLRQARFHTRCNQFREELALGTTANNCIKLQPSGSHMKKITTPNDPAHHIAVFQETTIRRVWHNEEWWFAIVDVVGVLTDSADPRQYIKKMRSRDPALDANWGTTCTPLALPAPDGKQRETNCANTEGLFRIIQSIPSPKAEPFKRWLAQVGYERVKEIENPELASARARELYQAKGYPKAWIEKRLRSISVRQSCPRSCDGCRRGNRSRLTLTE